MDNGFHILVSAGATSHQPSGERIVLLHGWLQSSDVWLKTACNLRDRYHHDVLVLDWWGHGRSHTKNTTTKLRVETLEEQLINILRYYGWDTGRPLIFAGISLGGAILLRYQILYPDRVGRIVLVCSAGLSESWYTLPSLTYPLRASILMLGSALGSLGVDKIPGLSQMFEHVQLISTTPTYGIPEDMPKRLAERRVPLSLIWGRFDLVHSAQLKRWRTGRGPETVDSILLPFKGHAQLCSSIDELELWGVRHFWSLSEDVKIKDGGNVYDIEKRSSKGERQPASSPQHRFCETHVDTSQMGLCFKRATLLPRPRL
mmetsp:Transcript_3374/g.7206  ORF Transcript_3374/g.7206 Transcript_3374/m.7206 type:complete len:316 (+) Transcript_3374:71-1018(+)